LHSSAMPDIIVTALLLVIRDEMQMPAGSVDTVHIVGIIYAYKRSAYILKEEIAQFTLVLLGSFLCEYI